MTLTTTPPPTLERLTLSGGLPLLIQRRPGPAILAARLSIRGGSSLDPIGLRGAHQLIAGLMTRGCGTLDAEALADLVEGAGAHLRAEAHEDALVLGLKCASEDTASLLPLLISMVRSPSLASDQLDLERQLTIQTLQRQKEDPFQLAHDQLRRRLYGEGPYGHDPLGIEAELTTMGQRHLRPLVENLGGSGAVLALCGDPPEGLVDLLERGLADSPWATFLPRPETPSAWQPPAERLAAWEEDTEQLVLMLGTATVPFGHPDALPLRLLQAHLGMGMSSRLFLVIREERGLAYDVGAHFPARCAQAPFVLHLSTSADRAEEATICLIDEWQRCLETPLEPQELHLALAKLRGHDAMGLQTCSQIAERQALLLSHGLPVDQAERLLERAAQLGSEDLMAAAQCWLPSPSLSLVGPPRALEAAKRAWRNHPFSGGNPVKARNPVLPAETGG